MCSLTHYGVKINCNRTLIVVSWTLLPQLAVERKPIYGKEVEYISFQPLLPRKLHWSLVKRQRWLEWLQHSSKDDVVKSFDSFPMARRCRSSAIQMPDIGHVETSNWAKTHIVMAKRFLFSLSGAFNASMSILCARHSISSLVMQEKVRTARSRKIDCSTCIVTIHDTQKKTSDSEWS